jgi:hypothetical protein
MIENDRSGDHIMSDLEPIFGPHTLGAKNGRTLNSVGTAVVSSALVLQIRRSGFQMRSVDFRLQLSSL